MSQKGHQNAPDLEERQLCVNCMTANKSTAHFCIKCGAPLTSYAATGPFESIFAEGSVYRQAAERPRSFLVVTGVQLLFGMLALEGIVLIALNRNSGFLSVTFGAFMLVVSLVMILKSTWNYLRKKKGWKENEPG